MILAALVASGCLGTTGPEASVPWEPPLDHGVRYEGDWPSVEDARIRPGARIEVEGAGSCTSNFLFRTPDNRTLYLGTAAHCFGDPQVGTDAPVLVPGFGAIGRVAFNAWQHTGEEGPDFGLIRIHDRPSVRAHVHPAMLHYGGPVGLADSSQAGPGTHILGYGNSTSRAQDDPENPREGWIVDEDEGNLLHHTEHPSIPGDSGSGLMTTDGEALCVVILAFMNPLWDVLPPRDTPNLNWCEPLDRALQHAAQVDPSLSDLELVTWPMIRHARLPDPVTASP